MERPGTAVSACLVLVAVLAAAGCNGESGAGTLAPELRKFIVQVPSGAAMDLMAPPAGGVEAVVATQEFKLVFNQLLDGDKIETVLPGGKVEGKTDVASIVWVGAPAGARAITARTTYNPAGALGVTQPGPSVLIAGVPGLPSGAKVAVTLVRAKITSKKGTAFVGPDTQMVDVAPFSVEANIKEGELVASEFVIKLTFNNTPADGVLGRVVVSATGIAVATEMKADETDPRVLVLTAKEGAWKAGGRYVLSVGLDATDLFGVALPVALSINFAVASPAPDGGAAP
jgi:hypothetical protein